MTAVWPSALPKPDRAGFQLSRGESRMRRASGSGVGGMRRRFSGVADLMAMTLDLSRYELGLFDGFFADALKGGSLPFTMPDPITDGWPMTDAAGRVLTDGGGVALLMSRTLLCQFGEQLPSVTVAGIRFKVAFTLEILP